MTYRYHKFEGKNFGNCPTNCQIHQRFLPPMKGEEPIASYKQLAHATRAFVVCMCACVVATSYIVVS